MKHIQEHILEQYVLSRNRDVISLRDDISTREIEQHLAECYGCRETFQRIRTFYANLNTRLESVPDETISSANPLARIEQRITVKDHSDLQFYEELPMTFWGKMIYSAKRHPVAAGSSTFALFAMLVALYAVLIPSKKDMAPDHYDFDEQNKLVVIRNKEFEPLWKFPVQNVRDIKNNYAFSSRPFKLADIDNDGKKEFLTSALRVDDNSNSSKLRVYDDNSSLQFEYVPTGRVAFRERIYDEQFFSQTVDVMTSNLTGEKLIVVNYATGRSPSALSVLDSKGNVLGTYYHFGDLATMFKDTLADGKEYLFLAGSCDIEEFEKKQYSSYAVFTVLDPSKIVGNVEASHTRGFGFPASAGEIYYVRFPYTDIDRAVDAFRAGASKSLNANNAIIIRQNSGSGDTMWDFDYTFNRNLIARSVKASDGTYQIHESLKRFGKLTGKIDSTYLNNLRQRVEYWDGRHWQNRPAVIQHF